MSLDTDILRQELHAGDAKTAQLYEALTVLRENAAGITTRTVLDALICGPEEFEQRLQREQTWCAQARDSVSVIEIAFDEALSAEEEAKFAEQLLELANNPTDFVGVTGECVYAVALASVEERDARRLLDVATGMAAYAAPARDFRCGYQSLSTVAPRAPIALQPAPNRTAHRSLAYGGRAL